MMKDGAGLTCFGSGGFTGCFHGCLHPIFDHIRPLGCFHVGSGVVILALLVVCFVLPAVAVVWRYERASEAWEDAEGFHVGREGGGL